MKTISKTVVIHQPDFLPHLAFFHRLLHADLWIALDHVQFTKGGSDCWTYRDKIKTPDRGKWLVLTVNKCPLHTAINEVTLSRTIDWKTRNLNQIKENYRKAQFFKTVFPYVEALYGCPYEKMVDFNMQSIRMLLELFDIEIEVCFSSSLNPKAKSNEMLVDLLRKVDARMYLSGIGAKDYFDRAPFEEARIEVVWQEFKHPAYPQISGEFVPYLSSIDLFFNCGIEKAREILKSL